jgi:hypothetical protein
MKTRSTLSTLISLSAALDVNFSIFDALDDAEAAAKLTAARRPMPDPRRIIRQPASSHAQAR